MAHLLGILEAGGLGVMLSIKGKVYLAWKSDCADYYDHSETLLGVYATRELADARVSSEPPGYEISYYVTEEEVLEQ